MQSCTTKARLDQRRIGRVCFRNGICRNEFEPRRMNEATGRAYCCLCNTIVRLIQKWNATNCREGV